MLRWPYIFISPFLHWKNVKTGCYDCWASDWDHDHVFHSHFCPWPQRFLCFNTVYMFPIFSSCILIKRCECLYCHNTIIKTTILCNILHSQSFQHTLCWSCSKKGLLPCSDDQTIHYCLFKDNRSAGANPSCHWKGVTCISLAMAESRSTCYEVIVVNTTPPCRSTPIMHRQKEKCVE